MRALVPFLIVVGIGLVGIRLYFASKMDAGDATRARKILWKTIDVLLVLIGGAAAAALVFFLGGVLVQMWQNLT